MNAICIHSVYTTGLIDFLLSAEPEAEVLRDRLVFKIGESPPLYRPVYCVFSHTAKT